MSVNGGKNNGDQTKGLQDLFRGLMGRAEVSLYPFQQKVANQLLSRRNVILRAPTGAGKTWAALLPFLLARQRGLALADRVLYALPLRSLASQLYGSTVGACAGLGWAVETTPNDTGSTAGARKLHITIQTGEQQNDPLFRGDIIFTTIDQLLSAYILDPASLPQRLANINVGAILGSLVVFDEFHLLQPDKSMGTAIEMLNRLRPYCQFMLMTATLSDAAVKWLSNQLDAEVLGLEDKELGLIESRKPRQQPTQRKWVWSGEGLSARAVLDRHRQRTLVICNTVVRAQEIYRAIVRDKRPETDVCLLHSRFLRKDRLRWEEKALSKLGKDNQCAPRDFILVSTQVVEAGMDFSVDTLHSELAPMNSLIQRAGRCVRYGGNGLVVIYSVPHEAPYDRAALRQTAELLQRQSGQVFDFNNEIEAVNTVHSAAEIKELREYDNLNRRRIKVNHAMDGLFEGAKGELIRDVHSINVLVTDEPEKLRFNPIWEWPEMLSVPYGTMCGFVHRTPVDPGDWLISIPVETDEDPDNERVLRFRWQRMGNMKAGLPWLVAVNPCYAHYSAEEGLLLGYGGEAPKIRYQKKQARESYSYLCETYSEHIALVMKHLDRLMPGDPNALRCLSNTLALPLETIWKAVRLAVVLHDVGKLSREWQKRTRAWQEYKTPGRVPEEPLAHTDFDPKTDWEARRGFQAPPAHAAEGAYAVCEYLSSVFRDSPEVGLCVLTAIARHHSGHAHTLKEYSLIPMGTPLIGSLVGELGLPPPQRLLEEPDHATCGAEGEFAYGLLAATSADDAKWLPLYWYLVRCLRLADQAGTAEGGQK